MLTGVAIRDIVLIERLDLALRDGLCVFTGETGAGKSILLDALGLALGARADRGLVRRGAARGSVSAAFALADDDPVHALLAEHGIEPDDPLVLRRVVGGDGRSRAFVNDQPVGTALLRRVGELMIEVHGQHEQQGLLDGTVQRRLLDGYGQSEPLLADVRAAYGRWRETDDAHREAVLEAERMATQENYWRDVVTELDELAAEPDEEDSLVETRTRLMHREKLAQAITEALELLGGDGGIERRLGGAQRAVERLPEAGRGLLDEAAAALERTRVEAQEASAALERAAARLETESDRLERVEERLFALRAAARKYRVDVSGLGALRDEAREQLARIETGNERIEALAEAAAQARAQFVHLAGELSAARSAAGARLGEAVMAELPALRLDKARFRVRLEPLADDDWSGEGAERVVFEVATVPGHAPGPIGRIASGGELARLMLALKVVLARVNSTPCLVFDEVDTGIGGATADAVGERLARLARSVQVLVVTHAPQVAARADHHFRVEKRTHEDHAAVSVVPLEAGARREEIARMLAGARITDAARAAADSLIARPA